MTGLGQDLRCALRQLRKKPNFPTGSISYPNFLDWRAQSHSFSQMTYIAQGSFNLAGQASVSRKT